MSSDILPLQKRCLIYCTHWNHIIAQNNDRARGSFTLIKSKHISLPDKPRCTPDIWSPLLDDATKDIFTAYPLKPVDNFIETVARARPEDLLRLIIHDFTQEYPKGSIKIFLRNYAAIDICRHRRRHLELVSDRITVSNFSVIMENNENQLISWHGYIIACSRHPLTQTFRTRIFLVASSRSKARWRPVQLSTLQTFFTTSFYRDSSPSYLLSHLPDLAICLASFKRK